MDCVAAAAAVASFLAILSAVLRFRALQELFLKLLRGGELGEQPLVHGQITVHLLRLQSTGFHKSLERLRVRRLGELQHAEDSDGEVSGVRSLPASLFSFVDAKIGFVFKPSTPSADDANAPSVSASASLHRVLAERRSKKR